MKRLAIGITAGALLLLWTLAALAQLPQKVTSIEGVTEYRLPNGLKVLTIPDPGADTITIHIVYLVGSRHEGYGEKGMAHLLEHMLFKGSTHFPDVKSELTRRGARWNGTTSNDRTNYFETLSATPANLDWALAMEADRMVNSRVSRQDLDSEMTVVRNEFEMGENNPGSVLFQRMQKLAYAWHNYGDPTIGERADIERVPIDKLQAFYRVWYQPDNAVLLIAGRFDEQQALELVTKHFGPIPKPSRVLPSFYTEEPTQDGERTVVLRRAGDNPMIAALYRTVAGSHPQYPAIDVLVQVLGDVPSGRLHKALVQKGLAASAWAAERQLHDPGYMYFGAELPKGGDIAKARSVMTQVLEDLAMHKITAAEVERGRTRLLNDIERAQLDSGQLVSVLSENEAIGDWRLFYLYRDELKKVTVADVQKAAEEYLKRANRVSGTFVPTAHPDRAVIPPTPDVEALLQGYKGGKDVHLGEAFDPSPKNIESRLQRRKLANGINTALLAKQTRGGRAVAVLNLHWGDEKTLMNREVPCDFAGQMLLRGTKKRSRAGLKEAFDKLNARVSLSGEGFMIEARGENLVPALRLAAEAMREPSFPPSEFEELKRAALAGAQAELSDPGPNAAVRLSRYLEPYPVGHRNYTPTLEERIEWIRKATLKDAQSCYRDLMGATGADLAVVGEFDKDAVAKAVGELFGPWRNPHPFTRVPSKYFDRPAIEDEVLTPDKANAVLRGGENIQMRDDNPDFPALLLGNYLLGGSSSSRIWARVREKEGLSYSSYSSFNASPFDDVASFRVAAIFAPQNRERVEKAMREEVARAVKDGFSAAEVEAGKKGLLESRRLARTRDRALANRIGTYLYIKRTFAWDSELESKIAALTPDEVNAVLKKYIDPAKLSLVMAGDFKK
ncbi:MAG TPA: pitrilysin family protein [Burkholderiales bacterium]|nr:pitrilysin family protein [Burkholderiales bacterium]